MMGNIIAAIVVLGILGALFGLILAVASKVFEVKKDPREEAILSHLAGANCGGCGYPRLRRLRRRHSGRQGACERLRPCRPRQRRGHRRDHGHGRSHRRASGGLRPLQRRRPAAKKRYEYVGVHDCISATKVAAGPLECRFGCLGFGSCVNACQFGAMTIGPNGTAVVDPDKCTDCVRLHEGLPPRPDYLRARQQEGPRGLRQPG